MTLRMPIARRILVNYRVRPEVIAPMLPPPLKPIVVRGFALAGVCLIRLEKMRLPFLPAPLGFASENAAHRIAVEWDDGAGPSRGVFIPRRDSDSLLQRLAGGRLFPGIQHPATFRVLDAGGRIELDLRSRDGKASVRLAARPARGWPGGSVFGTLEEASAFFAAGACGWSPSRRGDCLDGVTLWTDGFSPEPLEVEKMESSFFADPGRFPPGSIELDCALILRDLRHEWRAMPTGGPSRPRRGGHRSSRSAFFDLP